MLAQNFKSEVELGISFEVYDALIKVLGMLERGTLKHVVLREDAKTGMILDNCKEDNAFNMAHWECGTVRCIGGWVRVLANKDPRLANKDNGDSAALWELFYPIARTGDIHPAFNDYKNITTEQAAFAVRSYLTTGKPNWREAFKLTDA